MAATVCGEGRRVNRGQGGQQSYVDAEEDLELQMALSRSMMPELNKPPESSKREKLDSARDHAPRRPPPAKRPKQTIKPPRAASDSEGDEHTPTFRGKGLRFWNGAGTGSWKGSQPPGAALVLKLTHELTPYTPTQQTHPHNRHAPPQRRLDTVHRVG